MRTKSTLTAERVREVLGYNPETGVFRWKVGRSRGVRIGDVAGSVIPSGSSKGYRDISIDGIDRRAHLLAWFYVYGEWPTLSLDHRNGNRDDNQISNLREATQGQNSQNRHGPQRNNTSGFLGVSRNRRRWQAKVTVDGRQHHLGTFDTPEEASEAYLAAKRELHPFWDEAAG